MEYRIFAKFGDKPFSIIGEKDTLKEAISLIEEQDNDIPTFMHEKMEDVIYKIEDSKFNVYDRSGRITTNDQIRSMKNQFFKVVDKNGITIHTRNTLSLATKDLYQSIDKGLGWRIIDENDIEYDSEGKIVNKPLRFNSKDDLKENIEAVYRKYGATISSEDLGNSTNYYAGVGNSRIMVGFWDNSYEHINAQPSGERFAIRQEYWERFKLDNEMNNTFNKKHPLKDALEMNEPDNEKQELLKKVRAFLIRKEKEDNDIWHQKSTEDKATEVYSVFTYDAKYDKDVRDLVKEIEEDFKDYHTTNQQIRESAQENYEDLYNNVYRAVLDEFLDKNNFRAVSSTQYKDLSPTEKSAWESFVSSREYAKAEANRVVLLKGMEIEREHSDLYDKLKQRLSAKGVPLHEIMPAREFYSMIASKHLEENKDYYDILDIYVEGIPPAPFEVLEAKDKYAVYLTKEERRALLTVLAERMRASNEPEVTNLFDKVSESIKH